MRDLKAAIETFLLGNLDELAEIGAAHESAAHQTSWGNDDSHSVHERDARVSDFARDMAEALTNDVPQPATAAKAVTA